MTRGATFGIVIGLLLASPSASAELRIAAQIDGGLLYAQGRGEAGWSRGPGVQAGLAVGWEASIDPMALTLEVVWSHAIFDDGFDREVGRLVGGLRLQAPGTVTPSLFVHAGRGSATGSASDRTGMPTYLYQIGYTLDAGLGLEVPLDVRWSFGAEAAYHVLVASNGSGDDVTHWPTLGISIAVRL